MFIYNIWVSNLLLVPYLDLKYNDVKISPLVIQLYQNCRKMVCIMFILWRQYNIFMTFFRDKGYCRYVFVIQKVVFSSISGLTGAVLIEKFIIDMALSYVNSCFGLLVALVYFNGDLFLGNFNHACQVEYEGAEWVTRIGGEKNLLQFCVSCCF